MELLRDVEAQEAAGACKHPACFHCGTPCFPVLVEDADDRPFCCQGCRLVCELLESSGLSRFYDLESMPGIRMAKPIGQFTFLDDQSVAEALLDFSDETVCKVTFLVPAIHCIACVWLLENLFRLHPGVGRSQVNFPRKEVAITYKPDAIRLSGLAELLASLGYEPQLNLGDLGSDQRARKPNRNLTTKIGVAGFVFGNVMLMSLPMYLGLNAASDPTFVAFFGYVGLALILPVLLYSASDYWRAALLALQKRQFTIDFPIALGIAALFLQSTVEIVSGAGPGYLDSLSGLVFFLLCGRWFQQRSYDSLAFDRDYTAYFPLSVVRRESDAEITVPLTDLNVGDHIVVRHQELVPADSTLLQGHALIDYSFVTGESEPVGKSVGDRIYAGGRQVGGAIELETTKPVSQSYLTSMWEDQALDRDPATSVQNLTDRMARRFTLAVVALAMAAGLAWWVIDASQAVRVFSAVLIVACPCALALSAPFSLGTAWRILGKRHIYLRGATVVENLSRIDAIVFDKTGTLTHAQSHDLTFVGDPLSPAQRNAICSLARHSTHPHALSIQAALATSDWPLEVTGFYETPGCGIEGTVQETMYQMGSRSWLEALGANLPVATDGQASVVYVVGNGLYLGHFLLRPSLRDDLAAVSRELRSLNMPLTVISGDRDRDRDRLASVLGPEPSLHFDQGPHDKLEFIDAQQSDGTQVMMIGDGLNDAGALRRSAVGVAVTEDTSSFSPACDIILDGSRFRDIPALLGFSRSVMRVIVASFVLSFLYNAIGLTFAVTGHLSPLICAVLMPLSSVTVVAFAVFSTGWMARRIGLTATEAVRR